MNHTIYYFSGTGNSLWVSKELRKQLTGNTEIIAISSILDKDINIDSDTIGIVFPVYYLSAPVIVRDFIKRMKFNSNPYIFSVATCNGAHGFSLLEIEKLFAKHSKKMSIGIAIDLPGNAILTDEKIEKERLKASQSKIKQISNSINSKKVLNIDETYSFRSIAQNRIISFLAKKMEFTQKKFIIRESCVNCGICEKVCPVNNILMVENKPRVGQNCTNCLACFHWCPNESIYLDNFSIKDRRRYHHPEIKLKEMFLRNIDPSTDKGMNLPK